MTSPIIRDAASVQDCSQGSLDDAAPSEPVKTRWWLSLELALFLGMVGFSLSSSVFTQLLLVRNCQNMFPTNKSSCDMLVNKTDSPEDKHLEALVQPHVSVLQMYKTVIEACIPAVMSLYLGPWSDRHGRKPLIMWPMFGHGITFVMYTFMSGIPDLHPDYFLLCSIPMTFSGGLVTMISGMYAYTSDTTSERNRAFRMGMLDASLFGGLMVGLYVSAKLFTLAGNYGYVTVFGTSATCSLLGFLYLTFLPESIQVNEDEHDSGGICSLFDSRLVVTMLATCSKKRENHGRAIMFLVIVILTTFVITLEGESTVAFLYTRSKFGWDLGKYTTFNSVSTLTAVLGAVVGMYVFSVWLKVADSLFAMVVFAMKCAQTLIYALAPKDWYMYVGIAVGVLGGVSGPLSRSILSKTVPLKDIGAVFAFTSSLESLVPIAASPLYTFVYNATILTVPGAFYIVSAALFAVDVALMCVVVLFQRSISPQHYRPLQTPD